MPQFDLLDQCGHFGVVVGQRAGGVPALALDANGHPGYVRYNLDLAMASDRDPFAAVRGRILRRA